MPKNEGAENSTEATEIAPSEEAMAGSVLIFGQGAGSTSGGRPRSKPSIPEQPSLLG
jgi:hypothetical protein